MNSKHTPGPWTRHEKGIHPHPYVCGSAFPTEYGEDKFVISYQVGMNTEANARLIAAAPELLEALKELLAACEDDCGAVGDLTEFDGDDEPVGGGLNEDGSPDPMTLTFGHLRRAARAIAKAEGRTND